MNAELTPLTSEKCSASRVFHLRRHLPIDIDVMGRGNLLFPHFPRNLPEMVFSPATPYAFLRENTPVPQKVLLLDPDSVRNLIAREASNLKECCKNPEFWAF
jgi:hypothetical protein